MDVWNYYAPITRGYNVNARPDMTSARRTEDGRVAYQFSDGRAYTAAPQDFTAVVCSMTAQAARVSGDASTLGPCASIIGMSESGPAPSRDLPTKPVAAKVTGSGESHRKAQIDFGAIVCSMALQQAKVSNDLTGLGPCGAILGPAGIRSLKAASQTSFPPPK